MQVSAATFTDPAMRSQLKKYYESKIASVSEELRARGDVTLPKEITYTDPDGKVHKAGGGVVSAEKMIGALATFDQWIEFQIEEYKEGGWADRLAKMPSEKEGMGIKPDSKFDVSTTFANNGELLAFISDGGVTNIDSRVTRYTDKIVDEANKKSLMGQARVDYLTREVKTALSAAYPELQIKDYTPKTTPTFREFANTWYKGFDVDEVYKETSANAKEVADSFRAQRQQLQDQLREIETYLLSFQEVA